MRRLCMVLPIILLFASWIFPLLVSDSHAQTVEWAKRYNGPANYNDSPSALAVDAQGNVYVTGYSYGAGSNEDYATIKYGPNGDQLWVRRYNGPGNVNDEASALAVDAQGNVYVTGYSTGIASVMDYTTIKYGPNGDRLWVRRYNGPGNSYDQARALAVDAQGNVYVTGYSVGAGSSGDYATIKYGPNGDRLWVRRYNGPGNASDAANDLGLDGQGNVYVTGYSDKDGSGEDYWDYLTLKYSPSGQLLWVRRYNGPADGHDAAYHLAVDDQGNVYVTGNSDGGASYIDYATIKYSPNGNRLWVRRYNGPGNSEDRPRAIVVDAQRNVYVTGESVGVGSYHDYLTLKYSPAGVKLWARRYNSPTNTSENANAVAVDDQGNVYVTGESQGEGTSSDFTTIKYSPAGVQLWVKRYNNRENGYDSARALAVDAQGNVYVTGLSFLMGADDDYVTIKYSQKSSAGPDMSD